MSTGVRLLLIGVLTCCASTLSFAMQMGATKGSAVFGRSLDLLIPVRFDASIEDPFNCFNAEIFQADTKFDVGRVRIDVTSTANRLDATVRIRSISPIVEPWVKVILRNNCGANVTRQYDFLTDFAVDSTAINPTADASLITNNLPASTLAPSATSTNQVRQVNLVRESDSPLTPLNTPIKQKRKVKPKVIDHKSLSLASKIADTKVADPKIVNALGQVAKPGQSRLTIENFALTDEHQVLLKLSSAMVAHTGMRTPEEIQALAQATAVWRALNGMPALVASAATTSGQPEFISSLNPASISKSISSLNSPAVTDIQNKQNLDLKDSKNAYSNPIVYGLLGLLALTLACIAWLWLHVRRGTHPEYGWLHETALVNKHEHTEPTQFMSTHFHETAYSTDEQVNAVSETQSTPIGIDFEAPQQQPKQQLAEAAFDASPLAVLLSSKNTAAKERKNALANEKIRDKASKEFFAANSPEKSPVHFDDSRFDERHLNAQRISKRPIHDRPITSPTELIDLVIDSPHKLRAVPKPVPVEMTSNGAFEHQKTVPKKVKKSAQKTIPKLKPETLMKAGVQKVASKETKSNMIDFEIFAEPVPMPKPSRFVN